MSVVRTLAAALAILATVLTAGAAGAARGQAMAVGEIVLCANGMAVTLPVDADGQPTGVPHWCPDCALTLLTGLPAAPALPVSPNGTSAALRAAPQAQATGAPLPPVPPARGPPAA
jgi:hypothetical protein